jgi:4-hydroxy-3-methylbut-2-enyl diphosphate reductase
MIPIEIDDDAGFCFGVTDAIKAAEDYLKTHDYLFCLGEIVHNENELQRLKAMGLKIISREEFKQLENETVLIRAHGEPKETYEIAKNNHLHLLDMTCPIVKKLQQRIFDTYHQLENKGMIIIYGKKNHPEVIGLKGQVDGPVHVVEEVYEIATIDLQPPIHIFSQTTKSKNGYEQIVQAIKEALRQKGFPSEEVISHNTICRVVARRADNLKNFVKKHDLILFVASKSSSNGKQLFEKSKQFNSNTFLISTYDDINEIIPIIQQASSIGITGATSTSFQQMEEVRKRVSEILKLSGVS